MPKSHSNRAAGDGTRHGGGVGGSGKRKRGRGDTDATPTAADPAWATLTPTLVATVVPPGTKLKRTDTVNLSSRGIESIRDVGERTGSQLRKLNLRRNRLTRCTVRC